jgi:hypothetical protein
MERTLTTINEQDHPKTTGRTGTITKQEDQEITTTTTTIARWPRDTRKTTIKETTTGPVGTVMTTETTLEAISSSGQGTQEITTSHPMICLMDPGTCIILILMGSESKTMQ